MIEGLYGIERSSRRRRGDRLMDLVAGTSFANARPIRHLDPVLLIAAALVGRRPCCRSSRRRTVALGDETRILSITSSSRWPRSPGHPSPLRRRGRLRFLKVYAGLIYASSVSSLVLVRMPLGTSVRGSQRWFELVGFQLAPSEIAKLA